MLSKGSWVFRAAPASGFLGIVLACIGVLGSHFSLLPPLVGFLFAVAGTGIGCLLMVVFGIWSRRWLFAILGGCVLILVIAGRAMMPAALPIHDISTDMQDPPQFLTKTAPYPDGLPETPAIQKEHYPDVAPLRMKMTPSEVWPKIHEIAKKLNWQIVKMDTEKGILEATDTTWLFRFVDDIAVRVKSDIDGSVIDVRSVSRVGRSDLGVNAKRILALQAALKAE